AKNRDLMVPSAYKFYSRGKLSIIRALSPHNDVLPALASCRIDVPFNSIIGQHAPGPVETGSDGVVPYHSSHLNGAESELVVRYGHRVYESPAAMEEIRRILRKAVTANQRSSALKKKVLKSSAPLREKIQATVK